MKYWVYFVIRQIRISSVFITSFISNLKFSIGKLVDSMVQKNCSLKYILQEILMISNRDVLFHPWWMMTLILRIHLQGVHTSLEWVKSNVLMLRSIQVNRATFRKNHILLQKIAFSASFVNCKIENGIFQPLCSNCLM